MKIANVVLGHQLGFFKSITVFENHLKSLILQHYACNLHTVTQQKVVKIGNSLMLLGHQHNTYDDEGSSLRSQ